MVLDDEDGREAEDDNNTAEVAEAAPEAGPQDAASALRAEAASHRRKAREAEAERDKLAGRVEALQRAEVERIAAAPRAGRRGLADPADLWRGEDVELSALLDDDGNIDREKVAEAVQKLAETRPHWLARPNAGSADQGRGRPAEPEKASFGAAMKRGGA